ncbi:MAG: hypothetical protein QF467_04740 [SAR202 cluster bacterium]|nr:hypothetical protein [SAR202 cluster bacterium]
MRIVGRPAAAHAKRPLATSETVRDDPGGRTGDNAVAALLLDHYFYYSFPFVTDFGFSILAIQDDGPAEGETGDPYYQIAAYFEYRDDTWSTTYVLDNSRHPEAAKRRRLVEISDNFQDSEGNIHLIIIDGDDGPRHYKKPAGSDTWSYTTLIEARNRGVSWIRLIEIDRKIYYVTAQWNIISVATEGGETFVDLDLRGQLGEQVYGAYLYIASSRSGTRSDSPHVDVLVLNGAAESYPNGENYYIRISKEFIKDVLE